MNLLNLKKILSTLLLTVFCLLYINISDVHAVSVTMTFPALINEGELKIELKNTTTIPYQIKINVWNNGQTFIQSASLNASENETLTFSGLTAKAQYIIDLRGSNTGGMTYSNIDRLYAVMNKNLNPYVFRNYYDPASRASNPGISTTETPQTIQTNPQTGGAGTSNPQAGQTYAPNPSPTNLPAQAGSSNAINECNDGIDNDDDGRADRGGVKGMEADPSCFSNSATLEVDDEVESRIIPCTNKCTFSDIFRLINNLIEFFLTVILIPLFIIIIIYAGVKYILAQGNPGKVANIKSILMNIVKGIILILCAWLIVRTIMTNVLNEDFKRGGVEFLGE